MGRQELEVKLGKEHISFTVSRDHSLPRFPGMEAIQLRLSA